MTVNGAKWSRCVSLSISKLGTDRTKLCNTYKIQTRDLIFPKSVEVDQNQSNMGML